MICELFVGGPAATPFVYPYFVDVPPLPERSMPVIFVWRVADQNFRFADAASGPTRPSATVHTMDPTPFSDGTTASDDDGEPAAEP